ncbi:hypothetical protein KUL17_34700 [Alteromonas sp. KUL17]|nr:hypothetical protein KUL17_34700 [Alteromonas sp. KUL17]
MATQNTRFQVSYGGIFEKQAHAKIEIYSRLLELSLGGQHLREAKQWNAYRDQIREVKNQYHQLRVLLTEDLDKKVLDSPTSSHRILTRSTDGHTPEEFINNFEKAKNEALKEMRKLLSNQYSLNNHRKSNLQTSIGT